MEKPTTNMRTAWLFLSLAAIGTGLAMQEQQILKERGEPVAQVQPGHVACISEFYLEQFTIAAHRQQVALMTQDWCLPTERVIEHPFVVLNEGGTNKAIERIRVFLPDDSTADLYVPVAAVTKGIL